MDPTDSQLTPGEESGKGTDELCLPEETCLVFVIGRRLQRIDDFECTDGPLVNLHVFAGADDFDIQAVCSKYELAVL